MNPLVDINWSSVGPRLRKTQAALVVRSVWRIVLSVAFGIPLALIFPPSLLLFAPMFLIFVYAWRTQSKSPLSGVLCRIETAEQWQLMAHSGLVYHDNREAQREKEKFLYYLTIAPLQWYAIGTATVATKTGPLIHRVKVTREIHDGLRKSDQAFLMFSAAANELIAWWDGSALTVIDPYGQSPQHPKTEYASKNPSFTYHQIE